MGDRYDRMTTAELHEDAARRTPPVDLSDAPTNPDRAQRLRDADAARDADAQVAARNASEAAERQQVTDAGQATEEFRVQRDEPSAPPEPVGGQQHDERAARAEGAPQPERPGDAAPYVSEEDLQHRLDAASGAQVPVQEPRDVPPVGGQQHDPAED